MEMLHQLGINETALIQFVIYAFSIIVLKTFVFTPYHKAVMQRKNRTQGSESGALEAKKQAGELLAVFEEKAKKRNSEVVQILDKAKKKAADLYETQISAARKEADDLIKSNQQQIAKKIKEATDELPQHSSGVAMAITSKLLGK